MNDQTSTRGDGILAAEYGKLFGGQWPPWLGGLLLGLLNVLMFAYAKPWGVADGVQNWGLWGLKGLGLIEVELASPIQFTTSVTNLSLIAGAMIAALLSSEFGFQFSYGRDLVRGLAGGVLLGVGSVLGIGCTIGGFFTSFSALSLAGPVMMVGLAIGAYLGLRLLLWDMARERPSAPAAVSGKSNRFNWRPYQPYMGAALLAAFMVMIVLDETEFTAAGITGNRSVLVLFGLALGLVNQRVRFCFVRAFREPFMTGERSMAVGAALALLVGIAGFAVIKGSDLSDMRDPLANVNPSVWIGSFSGGLIFGIGMVLVGGCASGSLWRAGEGQIKFWLVLAVFAVSNAVTSRVIQSFNLRSAWGDEAYFLPDLLGWPAALAALVAIPLLWIALTAWNEKSQKLVII